MNTILITGIAQKANSGVNYEVNIWGAREGEQIQFISSYAEVINGYSTLWEKAKIVAENYFKEHKFGDGAYTQYLDHLIML